MNMALRLTNPVNAEDLRPASDVTDLVLEKLDQLGAIVEGKGLCLYLSRGDNPPTIVSNAHWKYSVAETRTVIDPNPFVDLDKGGNYDRIVFAFDQQDEPEIEPLARAEAILVAIEIAELIDKNPSFSAENVFGG